MTLYRQLVVLLTLMYALVFAGTFMITVDNTRQYLVAQLQSHAQDTATSLGLSLSSPSVAGDVLLMKSMVDALFDRGEYRRILVENLNGEALIDRALDVKVYGVPDWFVGWMSLETPEASSKLMTGWRQAGLVRVRSHPGRAYDQLWKNAVETSRWSLGALLAAVVISGLALRVLLRSLRDVEIQALAIADQEFPRIANIPRTRELKRVVLAMNRMTEKISGLLADSHAQMDRLRGAAYGDAITGLGNEAAFNRELERLVTDREQHAYGIVALLRMRGLDEANHADSYALGDALLKAAAEPLREVTEAHQGVAARIGGALFALLIPDVPRSDVGNIIKPLISELSEVRVGELDAAGLNMGFAYYGGGQSAKALRERAETALNNAEREGVNTWHMYEATETAAGRDLSHEQRWRSVFENVIAQRAVVLAAQPVKTPDLGNVLHEEIFARIRPGEGDLVSAGVFFPMATRVGLAMALDKTIIEVAVEAATRGPSSETNYALNLSRASVQSPEFIDWLVDLLERHDELCARFSFEVAEGLVAAKPDEVLELARAIRSTGAEFGVDHGGARDLALDYLKRLKADYIKIDGSMVTGLEHDQERQAYLRSLLATARGLDIKTFALHIESEDTLDAARQLGFDGLQGYHVGRPEPV